jgi:CMP-N-acetylneuraminic acid synthetase
LSVLALVPARRGSKSVPHKNILSFRGKPLLVHSVLHGLEARNVDRVLVSTDSPEYRALALAAGAHVPFLRPEALAGDLSTDLEVFLHALEWLDCHEGYRPEVCVHLRPTYPTRTVEDVERVVDLLLGDPGVDSVRSVTLAPHTPYKMWRLGPGDLLSPLLEDDGVDEAFNQPRQALPPVYLQNAAVDAVRSRVIRGERSMTGRRVRAYVMDRFEDIDDWSEVATLETRVPQGAPPRGCTFAFDMDGVLATLAPGNDYLRAEPFPPAIALVKRLKEAGNRIVVYTARGAKTGLDWEEATRDQLRRWQVPHDELLFGKPPADYYVDDRMISLATLEAWIKPPNHRSQNQ